MGSGAFPAVGRGAAGSFQPQTADFKVCDSLVLFLTTVRKTMAQFCRNVSLTPLVTSLTEVVGIKLCVEE